MFLLIHLDLPYTTEDMKCSRITCVNKVGRGLWLDNTETQLQDKVSNRFLIVFLSLWSFPFYLEIPHFPKPATPDVWGRKWPLCGIQKNCKRVQQSHSTKGRRHFLFSSREKQIYLLKHCKLEESEFLGLFAKLFIT